MTTAVTTTDGPSITAAQVIDGPTLKELAATANHEHQQVLDAATSMVQHAIKVGEALHAARAQSRPGTWGAWLASNFAGSHGTASVYLRLALYQEHLPSDVETITQARTYLRQLPNVREVPGAQPEYSRAVQDEALRLRDSKMSTRAISEVLGVPQATLRSWSDPEERERARRYDKQMKERFRQEREERKRSRRDEKARRVGGSPAACYSQIRKTLQTLDRAHGDTTDRDARAALSAAIANCHTAEDQIARILGVA